MCVGPCCSEAVMVASISHHRASQSGVNVEDGDKWTTQLNWCAAKHDHAYQQQMLSVIHA